MKGGVRITAGELKGTRLAVPHGVRPTSQMVREALFSRWQSRLPGAHFLDLFAGSGAVGLEAVSRGAARVVAVEGRQSVERRLERVCQDLAAGSLEIVLARLPEEGRKIMVDGGFDLIFADPPYDFDRWSELLTLVAAWLAQGGEAALEHSVRVELPTPTPDLVTSSTRRYGDSCLSFYRRA